MQTSQGSLAQEKERVAAPMAHIQHAVARRHVGGGVQQLGQRYAVSVSTNLDKRQEIRPCLVSSPY